MEVYNVIVATVGTMETMGTNNGIGEIGAMTMAYRTSQNLSVLGQALFFVPVALLL